MISDVESDCFILACVDFKRRMKKRARKHLWISGLNYKMVNRAARIQSADIYDQNNKGLDRVYSIERLF